MLLLLTTAIAVKGSSGVDIVPAALNDFSVFGESSSSHPIYAEYFSGSSPRRSGNIEQIVAMPVPELALRLPRQNGLVFVPCPMSGCGNSHGTNWEFVPGAESVPDRVRCKSCQTLFPNPDFPETGLTAVKAPSGKTILYSYYEKKGFKYYLSSLVHYRQIHYYAGL